MNTKKMIQRFAMIVFCLFPTVLMTLTASADATDALTEQEKNSSYGFFVWLSEKADTESERADAEAAAQLLQGTVDSTYSAQVFNPGNIFGGSHNITYADLLAATDLGAENDATSLACLEDAVNFVTLGNQYRALENLGALKISSAMMAMSELNVNFQNVAAIMDHSDAFNALENLAYRQISGTWAYGSFDGCSDDPYEGWYTEEKANYVANNGGQTGHYLTLTDRKGTMVLTGFGVRHRFVSEQIVASDGNAYTCTMNDKYYSQHFSNGSSMYSIGTGVTPSKYLEYLDRYQCVVSGHDWDQGTVTTEATCTQNGTKKLTCSRCGETKNETITALGHDMKSVAAAAPTCTENGNIAYYSCDRCKKLYADESGNTEISQEDTIDPANGHTWPEDYTVDVPATCTQEGSESIHCSVCGAKKEGSDRSIGKTPHAYGEWTTTLEPTCTVPGSRKKVCGDCGDTVTEEISANGHTWPEDYTVDVPATCTQEGSKSIHCSVCGAKKEGSDRSIGKKPHAYGEWTTTLEPTCTVPGSRKKVCGDCGDTVTEEVPAKGHIWEKDYRIDKEATTKEPGAKSIYCSVCGVMKEGSTQSIPVLTETSTEPEASTQPGTTPAQPGTTPAQSGTTTQPSQSGTTPAQSGTTTQSGTIPAQPGTTPAQSGTTTQSGTSTQSGTTPLQSGKTPSQTVASTAQEVSSPQDSGTDKLGNKLVSEKEMASTILKLKNDKDPKGSTFCLLQAKVKKAAKNSITLSWKKVPGASSYTVYGNKCGKKYKKLGTVTGTTFKYKKLKKGKYYKLLVVANGDGKALAVSKTIHTPTSGGEAGDYKSVTITSKKSITIAVGKTAKIKAKAVKKNKKLKVNSHRGLAYESDNPAVATVIGSCKIKAVGTGNCTIYVYAQNGVFAKVKVRVP